MNDELEIPAGLDQLDGEWLARMLARHQGWNDVGQVRIEPLDDAMGFLGDHATVHIERAGEPHTLLVKMPTRSPGGRAVGEMLSVWWREHRFYASWAEHLDVAVPTARLNLADPTTGRYLLALDQLDSRSDIDQITGADHGTALEAAATLARLHASGADGIATGLDEVPGIDAGPLDHLQAAVVAALPRWRQRFGDRIDPGVIAGLERLAPRLAALVDGWTDDRLTLAHADFRLDNLLLTSAGLVVIDWQTAMRTTGVSDLALFCASSLTVEDRRRWEDELIELYLTECSAHGLASDRSVIRRRYGEAMWWWTAMLANNLSTIETASGRATELFETMMGRTATAAADHPLPAPAL